MSALAGPGLVVSSCFFFFFSSRRRHTRCLSDWSSDVGSSDLNHFDSDPDRDRRRHRAGAQGARMMGHVPLSWFLMLSAVLFSLGVAGFIFRRNIITMFMSIELILNAVNLTFITFAYQRQQVAGHLLAFFVMVVAAAEAAVGLAIILTVFKNRETLNIDDLDSMKN